jgi:bacillithiol system protein YtxJ
MEPEVISSKAELYSLLDASKQAPVWILKHSDECNLSSQAYRAFAEHAERSPHPHFVLTVQDTPDVSALAEHVLAIRHETPQVLLVRDGAVSWAVSHRGITLDSLTAADDQHR